MPMEMHECWRKVTDLLTSILPGKLCNKRQPRYWVENPQVIFCQSIWPDPLRELLESKFQKSFYVEMENDTWRIHAPRHLADHEFDCIRMP